MSFGRRRIPKHLIIEDYRHRRSNGIGWIMLAVFVLLVSMLLSVYVNADENVDVHGVDSGHLLFTSHDRYTPSLHLSSRADVDIHGLIAHVRVEQTFKNHTDQWQEGVYAFPLPENAAVHHMEMHVGERIIVGEIKKKAEAKALYQKAKHAGKRAALTEQLRPNLFSQRVANIPPKQTITVHITYIHRVDYDKGEFSWRFPMTITPRYFPQYDKKATEAEIMPGTTAPLVADSNGWANASRQDFDPWPLPLSVIDFTSQGNSNIENPMALTITLDSGLPLSHIDALFHNVTINKNHKQHRIELAQGHVNMDRDFVLHWRPIASKTPQAAVFSETIDNATYSLLMLMPPQNNQKDNSLPRDIVFVLDISGSMKGSAIRQAKESLNRALAQLRTTDRFNIVAFNTHYTSLSPSPLYADAHTIQSAIQWVHGLDAEGGTEMLPALQFSLQQLSTGQVLKQAVFITDGAVGNEKALFRAIKSHLGNARLFTVGIGSAPNTYFMKKAAQFGRGSFTHIGNSHEVSHRIETLFSKLNGTVAKNIRIDWPDSSSEIYPQKIPDLYLTEPLFITVKSDTLQGHLNVAGITALAPWQQSISLDNKRQGKGISTLWARAKIEALEDRQVTEGKSPQLQQEIVDIALQHQLLTPYTSFIAIEKTISRPSGNGLYRTPLQNMLPNGSVTNSLTPVQYPASATYAELSWWLGLFCLIMGIVILRLLKD